MINNENNFCAYCGHPVKECVCNMPSYEFNEDQTTMTEEKTKIYAANNGFEESQTQIYGGQNESRSPRGSSLEQTASKNLGKITAADDDFDPFDEDTTDKVYTPMLIFAGILTIFVMFGIILFLTFRGSRSNAADAKIKEMNETAAVDSVTSADNADVGGDSGTHAVTIAPTDSETTAAASDSAAVTESSSASDSEPADVSEAPSAAAKSDKVKNSFEVTAEPLYWEEAKQSCINKGGHLAYVKTADDLSEIISQAERAGLKYLWVGGTSTINGGKVTASWLDGSNAVGTDMWYPNEPSGKDGDISEPYLMLWKIDGSWALNDNSDRIFDFVNSNEVGYVCQYD